MHRLEKPASLLPHCDWVIGMRNGKGMLASNRGEALTSPVWSTPDEGGQHLDYSLIVRLLLQPHVHLSPHPPLHLQQHFLGEAEVGQGLLYLPVLLSQAVGHGRHHGSPLAAATLREEETYIRVRHQAPQSLVETS